MERPNLTVRSCVANWNRSKPPSGSTEAGGRPVLTSVVGNEARGTNGFTDRLFEDFNADHVLVLMITFCSEEHTG